MRVVLVEPEGIDEPTKEHEEDGHGHTMRARAQRAQKHEQVVHRVCEGEENEKRELGFGLLGFHDGMIVHHRHHHFLGLHALHRQPHNRLPLQRQLRYHEHMCLLGRQLLVHLNRRLKSRPTSSSGRRCGNRRHVGAMAEWRSARQQAPRWVNRDKGRSDSDGAARGLLSVPQLPPRPRAPHRLRLAMRPSSPSTWYNNETHRSLNRSLPQFGMGDRTEFYGMRVRWP